MRARLVLVLGVLIAFGASLGSGFHFDDYAIFSDPVLTSPGGWREVWRAEQTRPLSYFTFWLNYRLGGTAPAGYHAVNLALHLAAVLLAYEVLRRLLEARVALVAAGVFAVHPLQAEAVNYVWARPILLATVLCLLAGRAWLRDRPWVAVAWFFPALLAKEECAAFPLALWLLRRGNRRALAAMLGMALAAGARVVWATSVVPGAPAGWQAGISPWHYALAQGTVIWRYARLFALPWGFNVDPDIAVPPVWLGLAAWAALAAVALWPRPRKWLCATLILLAPSSSLFPAADLAADRRMYLPLIALAAAAALAALAQPEGRAHWAAKWHKLKLVPTVAVLAVLTAVSAVRTQVWMSEVTLWSEAVGGSPGKVRPKIQLARAVAPAEALPLLEEARRLAPEDAAVAAETGRALLALGRPAEALPQFGRALALAPGDARAYNNRGVALQALGQTEAARQDFERALRIDPRLEDARRNLEKPGPTAPAP